MQKAKTLAVRIVLIANVMLVGAVIGGYEIHQIDEGNAKTTQSVVQAALKAVPVAQAATSTSK